MNPENDGWDAVAQALYAALAEQPNADHSLKILDALDFAIPVLQRLASTDQQAAEALNKIQDVLKAAAK